MRGGRLWVIRKLATGEWLAVTRAVLSGEEVPFRFGSHAEAVGYVDGREVVGVIPHP